MEFLTLRQIYETHSGKSSDKWGLYLKFYEDEFNSLRLNEVRLLEIGVQNGGSLEIWSKYFSNAKAIVGCDINEMCRELSFSDKKISVVVGDANSAITNQAIMRIQDGYDIIIDDGSHTSSDIIKSFAMHFEKISAGGCYIIEDLHCSYWQAFEGGLYYDKSSMSFLKSLADLINIEHWGVEISPQRFLSQYQIDSISPAQLLTIHSIKFLNSLCIIRKKTAQDNLLGNRYIAGGESMVMDGQHHLHGLPMGKAVELNNKHSIVSLTDELVNQKNKISELSNLLSEKNNEVNQLQGDIAKMKKNISWRATTPLRSFEKLLRRIFIAHKQPDFNAK
jgi:hypothetical protein